MIVLFLFIIIWFGLGVLGCIIYQTFGDKYIGDKFILCFVFGELTFILSIALIIYERIEDFITTYF